MRLRFQWVISVFFVSVLMLICLSLSTIAIEIDESMLINGSKIAEKVDYNIVPGVTESYVVTQNNKGLKQVRSYVLEVDLSNPDIGIITSYKNYMNGLSDNSEWGMQAVRDQAVAAEKYYRNDLQQDGFEIVAGVNGDFFDMDNGAPRGTLVMNGKIYNVNAGWPYFAILKDGTPVIREGGSDVSDVAQSVGGPAIILRNGVADTSSGYGVDAHPRTAVGIKADGSVIFVVSDGRQAPGSCGQTFEMLVEEMLALGCVDALCLDGGGSSTFVSQREGETMLSLRSSPSDGIERTVSTAVLIYSNTNINKPTLANKWFRKNDAVGYYGADGVPVTGMQTINGFTYEFDSDGNLKAFASVNENGTLVANKWAGTYYLGEDGLPVKGNRTIDNKIFTFNNETSKLEKSELKNIWYKCGDSVCYFDAQGVPVTGEQQIGTYTYRFDETGKLDSFMFVNEDGTFAKNQWIGSQYYVGEDGLPVTGQQKIGKYTYTFGDDGKFIKGALVKEGNYTYYYIAGEKQRNWHLIDGYWHYFDRETGYGMATKENSDTISIDKFKDGMYTISTTDATLLFTFDSKGRLIRGSWLETENGKAYCWGNYERVVGWQYIDNSLYYFNNDTYSVTGLYTIDDVAYTFDAEGRLQLKNTSISINEKLYMFDAQGSIEHVYKIASVTAPTCSEKGYTTYICDCGDSYIDNFTDATGEHISGDWQIVIPAQIGKSGIEQKKCTVCGTILEEREIAAVRMSGDVNNDGKVTAADARSALRAAAKLDSFTDEQIAIADMDGDGKITAADARKILRISAKLD